jgi:parallel beta-helix repeat protein
MRATITVTMLTLSLMTGAFAGDLVPPTGAPTSTMKPLDQVEPRTPISTLPFSITQSGSYYLTGNLSLADPDTTGITIAATVAHVTIDLNGFELVGPGKEIGSSGSGILTEYSYPGPSVRIFNGMVRDWRQDGIVVNNSGEVDVHHVSVINNGGHGIALAGGSCGTVADCSASRNGGSGIVADGNGTRLVRHNTCTGNAGNGLRAIDGTTEENVCSYNTGHGILTGGGAVRGNTCRNNQMDGIYDYGDSLIEDNLCFNNHASGVHCSSYGSTILRNTCRMNLGTGLLIDVTYCYSSQNVLFGNATDENLGGSTEGAGDLANVIVPFLKSGDESDTPRREDQVGRLTPLPESAAAVATK